MISRASTASQLSSIAGIWDDADGRCVVISSSTSTAGDGVPVLQFFLPDTDGVVLLPALPVVVRRVVLVVVLPMPSGPVVEISEIKFKRKLLHCLFIVGPWDVLILKKKKIFWKFRVLNMGKISYQSGTRVPRQLFDQCQTRACLWFFSTQITENKIIAHLNFSVSYLMLSCLLYS